MRLNIGGGEAMVNCPYGGGVTKRNSLNWLFDVSCMVLELSSCILGDSNSMSDKLIGMCSSV